MTSTQKEVIRSDYAVSPGSVLAEELEARGMSQKELAARCGRPHQVINEIVQGKKAITPETALNLESTYRLTLARNKRRADNSREP